jgi:hypothetical protein
MIMVQLLETLVARIIAAERVTPEDTVALRQTVWINATIETTEAEALFAINNAAKKNCPQWVDFFVEAITAYLVEQTAPRGYIDDAGAQWLIAQIGKDGRLESRAELLLLVAILEKADGVAEILKSYAIAQVERTVLTGEGATRIGSSPRPGVVDEAEVALLRRIFFAPGSDGATVISTDEATALFRIKDATRGAENAPGWSTLFVQLIGNHLMAHQSYQPLSRERAAALEKFMADNVPNVGSFLSRMETAFLHPSQIANTLKSTPVDGVVDEAPTMTTDEANWLKKHIVADGQMDDIEKALLAFIIDESGPLPVEIEALQAMRAVG